MPRKLKTFVTDVGFFQLAVAAPSMQAALGAWGMEHNAFHQGFAKETKDARIVAAAEAKPGMVLQRPLGTSGAFTEKGRLPKVSAAKKLKAAKPKINQALVRAAEDALSRASARHEKAVKALRDERDRVQARIEKEDAAWQRAREKLEEALKRVKP
jgi:hypothetical protein